MTWIWGEFQKMLINTVIHAGFSVEEIRQMFEGPFFERPDKFLLFGEAFTFGEIFKKFHKII